MSDSTLLTKDEVSKESLFIKIKNFFVNFGVGVKNFFKTAVNGIKNFFKDPKTGFKNLGKALKKQNGWLFLLPAILLLTLFTFYPIVNSVVLAFMEDYNPIDVNASAPKFGFGNFVAVITNDVEKTNSAAEFMVALKNTLILAFISVPLSITVALLIAVALNSIKVLQKAYQTIFFLPYLTNALAMGAVFATFFKIVASIPSDPSTIETVGLVNNFLGLFGIEHINWIGPGSGTWQNYLVLIVYSTWSGLPFKILILFSALQNVGKQYYDAAKIDGANKKTILTKITVPLISPMLSYLLITGIMGALKAYSSVIGIFGGNLGPNGAGSYEMATMVGYIYTMIEQNKTCYAAAGSIILFIIIMIFTAINNQVSKKRVHY